MTDIKSKAQGIDPNIQALDIKSLLQSEESNVYESLNIISKRARQLVIDLKSELHQKLDEFAVTHDTIEEIHENKEQIEISKFYERLPNTTIMAMTEFLDDELEHKYVNDEELDSEL